MNDNRFDTEFPAMLAMFWKAKSKSLFVATILLANSGQQTLYPVVMAIARDILGDKLVVYRSGLQHKSESPTYVKRLSRQ